MHPAEKKAAEGIETWESFQLAKFRGKNQL
jgi:hypothetical protein